MSTLPEYPQQAHDTQLRRIRCAYQRQAVSSIGPRQQQQNRSSELRLQSGCLFWEYTRMQSVKYADCNLKRASSLTPFWCSQDENVFTGRKNMKILMGRNTSPGTQEISINPHCLNEAASNDEIDEHAPSLSQSMEEAKEITEENDTTSASANSSIDKNISTSTPNKEVFKAPAAKTAPSKKRKLEDPDQPSSTTSASRSKVTKVDSSSDSTSNSVLKYFNLNYERSSSNVVQMSGFRTNSIVNEDIGADSDCQSIVDVRRVGKLNYNDLEIKETRKPKESTESSFPRVINDLIIFRCENELIQY
ncbi:unnamed protein product [Trichogramma brassicae]|uniref:Uncharacterized protein n=1 Tax=Trichogramma brassicae TaxID=86971 RepID=A0A6H5J7R9_9HYME|nr:unnamed protein product [Trichogramma brassicae]